MSRTIKELADVLGVSKTAVRKYMTEEFRREHVETDRNGVITIDPAGCNLIAEFMGKSLETVESTGNKVPETAENTGNITIPRSVWLLMEQQIKEKDEQLRVKDQQIADLTATVRAQADSLQAAQALHAGTMQQMIPDGAPVPDAVDVASEPSEPPQKSGFWQRFKRIFE